MINGIFYVPTSFAAKELNILMSNTTPKDNYLAIIVHRVHNFDALSRRYFFHGTRQR